MSTDKEIIAKFNPKVITTKKGLSYVGVYVSGCAKSAEADAAGVKGVLARVNIVEGLEEDDAIEQAVAKALANFKSKGYVVKAADAPKKTRKAATRKATAEEVAEMPAISVQATEAAKKPAKSGGKGKASVKGNRVPMEQLEALA